MYWRHTDGFGEYVQLPLVHTETVMGNTYYFDAIVRNMSLFVVAASQGGP